MSNELARTILALNTAGARVVYGEATAVNTVALEGAATAVELPALTPVAAGDYCAVLQQGADRLILGPVGGIPRISAASVVGTTDGSGDLAISFGMTFGATPIVVAINGDRVAASFAPQIMARNTTGFTVRCDGAASTTVRVDYIAVGPA